MSPASATSKVSSTVASRRGQMLGLAPRDGWPNPDAGPAASGTDAAACPAAGKIGNHAADLVGVAGFELATPCTPCKCATRLRYTPTRGAV